MVRVTVVRSQSGAALASVIVLAAGLLPPVHHLFAQGCVIARGAGAGMILPGEGYLHPGDFQANLSYRWLHSDRHFVGGEEQKHRQREGTEVINDQHFFDVTLTYAATKRVWLNLTVPFVHSDRSSLYEHKGNASGERYHTQAGGLADVRLTSTVWLFAPDKAPTGNWALGVGVKAPTGDYRATDVFIRPEGPTLRYVDSSIQPGDGGWGVVLDTQAFVQIVKHTFAYMNGSYLINPRELVPETGYSVADSYLLRAGLSYALWPSKGLTLSFGGRLEGVPVEDWFGENEGFRRPGYTVSVEPGITWTYKKLAVTVTAPVAVERNRERSLSDIRRGRHGDAAFADFTINSVITYRF
jgi:hypothetical protein